MNNDLHAALALGDPQEVAALVAAGADIHFRTESGYDALLTAVHGRDVFSNPRLLDLLTLLIDCGVPLTGKSAYNESAVRVLSRIGRFDAVHLLLQAGADPADLENTALIKAVAFGSLADVEAAVGESAALEARDYWERTAWLVAIQTGDVSKAQLLSARGSDSTARGRCGKPPLFYALESRRSAMLTWLLERGADIHQTDDFGGAVLAKAAQEGNAEAVALLLQAGADVNHQSRAGTALSNADTRETAMLLLAAGADPLALSSKGRRAILGYPADPDKDRLRVSEEDFQRFRARRFGTRNPEPINNPFWEGMIRAGVNAFQAAVHLEGARASQKGYDPVWCADRFGQSLTFLGDGRIVQVAGEHEDHYDPDFCIYNDVFVHAPDGGITIYGYPDAVFSPTDFHTATLVGEHIYLIGSLGYHGTRRYGETPVYRLDTRTFRMEPLATTGEAPGWIYKHRAVLLNAREIRVTGGKVMADAEDRQPHKDNTHAFVLDIEGLAWRRELPAPGPK